MSNSIVFSVKVFKGEEIVSSDNSHKINLDGGFMIPLDQKEIEAKAFNSFLKVVTAGVVKNLRGKNE